MKKALSLLLSLALICSLSLPAAGAESADTRLSAVTSAVKNTLKLDTAGYKSFNGALEDSAALPIWRLNWSGTAGRLSISATESGKILRYSHYLDEGASVERGSFRPAFPVLSRDEAQAIAQTFLDRVLTPGVERARFDEEVTTGGLFAASYNFSGEVLENGLSSPFGFRINVRIADGAVANFFLNGSPEQYSGSIPSATPSADPAKAASELKSTLALHLEYVLEEGSEEAVLRYLPEEGDQYYVDGMTGMLVNLTERYQEINTFSKDGVTGGMGDAEAAPSAAPDRGMTDAEQAGIAKLEGVLPKAALDTAARKWNELGLGTYTLSSSAYQVDDETGAVTAQLQYARKDEDGVCRRSVSLDAKTGALLRVYSSRPWQKQVEATVTTDQARTITETFLKQVCPDRFGKTAAYGASDVPFAFTYAQQENGYFFPESSLTVTIDEIDGTVSAYAVNNAPEGVRFQNPEGIITPAAALDTWFATYDVALGYQAVPEALDLSTPEHLPLIDMGWFYLLTQKLGWSLEQDALYSGVDAKTGVAITSPCSQREGVSYSDLEGSWVKTHAEALATYGVGWLGGALQPGKTLTQIDLVALLVSTSGYHYDPAGGEQAADELYMQAYDMGLLTRAARNDGAVLTRGALVKLLLDGVGYGEVAGLRGIYRCSFADAGSIPEDLYGYAALAQGLGIVGGGSGGRFDAATSATRAEALSMLYRLCLYRTEG